MTTNTNRTIAYSVNDIVKTTGLGKTYVYDLIKTGQLRAKKAGTRTIVLAEELNSYLKNLPDFGACA